VTAGPEQDARAAVVKINEILYRNVSERLRERHFMTFNALRYLGDGKFEHAGAHLRIIVHRRETGECELIRTRGVCQQSGIEKVRESLAVCHRTPVPDL